MLPDAVDEDARRQWVGLARDRLGQFEPPAALVKGFAIGREHLKESVRRLLAERLRVATQVDFQSNRLRFLDRVRERILRWGLFLLLLGRLLLLRLLDD